MIALRCRWEVRPVKDIDVSPKALKLIDIFQERMGVRVYLKLRAWQVAEYEKVCLLDFDILVRQSMDPVFASRSPRGRSFPRVQRFVSSMARETYTHVFRR